MAWMEVTLWDEKMRLDSDQSEEFVTNVADYLNNTIKMVRDKDPVITTKILALRAAYHITAELFRTKQQFNVIEDKLAKIDELFE
jgi:cell division protein ZapA (FtsZ GTPase activity inhibitor)